MGEDIREETLVEEQGGDPEVEPEEFAEEPVEEDEEELAGEPWDEEEPLDEEPGEEEEPVEEEPQKRDYVPLAKYMAEKKRRQELERFFAQQQLEREKWEYENELIARGWPKEEAQRQTEQEFRWRMELGMLRNKQLDYEIRDLARSGDPFFADADSFKDELKQIMNEKRVGAEEAYMLLRGKQRLREMQLAEEQKRLAKRKEAGMKKVDTAAPGKMQTKYKLDEADRKALAELQKAQPEAGWTIEKYWKLMKKE